MKKFSQIRHDISARALHKKSRLFKRNKKIEYCFTTNLSNKTYIDFYSWIEYYNQYFPDNRFTKKAAIDKAFKLLFEKLKSEITNK